MGVYSMQVSFMEKLPDSSSLLRKKKKKKDCVSEQKHNHKGLISQ